MPWEGLYKGKESLQEGGGNIEKRVEIIEHHLVSRT